MRELRAEAWMLPTVGDWPEEKERVGEKGREQPNDKRNRKE